MTIPDEVPMDLRAATEIARLRDRIAHLEAEQATLRGAMAAQDERERVAGERCGVPYELHSCDWPEWVADEVIGLRDRIAELERICAESMSAAHRKMTEALEKIAENRVADCGPCPCLPGPCDCSECLARAALQRTDAEILAFGRVVDEAVARRTRECAEIARQDPECGIQRKYPEVFK